MGGQEENAWQPCIAMGFRSALSFAHSINWLRSLVLLTEEQVCFVHRISPMAEGIFARAPREHLSAWQPQSILAETKCSQAT